MSCNNCSCNSCQMIKIQSALHQQQQQARQQQAISYTNIMTPTGPVMDMEYVMFKKFAALDDGEAIKEFLNELQEISNRYDYQISSIELHKRHGLLNYEEGFLKFCEKYKKSITKERIDKVKLLK